MRMNSIGRFIVRRPHPPVYFIAVSYTHLDVYKRQKLVRILLDKNDYTTLKKVTVDPDFRQKMFEHYGL